MTIMEPRECQELALKKFDEHYYQKDYDRGIISMCCGSGKTYTMYNIIKECINKHGEHNFVIATSRVNLIYQIYEEFIKWAAGDCIDLEIRIVGGSGEKFKKDTLQSEKSIRDVLGNIINSKKNLVIITTYKSAHMISEAINGKKDFYPNLLILDEAHNTTGENEKYHIELIKKSNEKFCTDKYLFMTATPVKLILKDSESKLKNDETTYSMDNENIYGKIIYEYTFYEGINIGKELVPFETIYLTQNDMIPKKIKSEMALKTKKEKNIIYFKTISNFLIDSIKDYKLKYTLVYLSNKEKMRQMYECLESLRVSKTFKCNIYTLISEYSKNKRDSNINGFKNKSNIPNILLSVSIFDEGVDVPCIDSVMFAEERNTQSRIVQNIGRCLRKSTITGKDKGYVIIPNIVYDFNALDDNLNIHNGDDNTNNFSSYYINIRDVITILNKEAKVNFYKKYARNGVPFDPDDEEINDIIEHNDITLNNDNANRNLNNNQVTLENNNEDILNLYQYYRIKVTGDDINNDSLQSVKKNIVQKFNITNVREYGKVVHEVESPYLKLHEIFKKDWKSWSKFLCDEIFSYEESKRFIYNIKNKFNSGREWADFYENIINNELYDRRNDDLTDDFIDNLMKIPNRPKEYYVGNWVDWSDFLGTEIENNILKKTNDEEKKRESDKNIKNLLNNDFDIIKLNRGEYNEVKINYDLSRINEHMNKINNSSGKITVHIYIKNNNKYDKCRLSYYNENNKIVSYIYPEESKIVSTTNIFNEKYIQDETIINDLKSITDECRKYLYNFKKYNGDGNSNQLDNGKQLDNGTQLDNGKQNDIIESPHNVPEVENIFAYDQDTLKKNTIDDNFKNKKIVVKGKKKK